MVQQLETHSHSQPEIIYPDSDGLPMADNTKQFRWIVVIKENLELLFAAIAPAFIAGDLRWYPVEGETNTNVAPDVMVVFGRPKGDRGSYKQWEEDNIPPQVVFEILSPGNRPSEMDNKLRFYQRFGVEEYYIYNPDNWELQGWLRVEDSLEEIDNMDGWVSPRLNIRFDLSVGELRIFTANGQRFLSFVELAELKNQAEQRAERAEQQAEQSQQQVEIERQRAEQSQQQVEIERQRAEQSQQQVEIERQRAEAERQRAEEIAAELENLRHQLQERGINLNE